MSVRTDNFARNLRRLRTRRGMSFRALSAALAECGFKMDASGIYKAEQRTSRITLAFADAVASYFGFTVDQLMKSAPKCPQCAGLPPTGFVCGTCGQSAVAS